MLTFIVFIWFTMKFVWPPIMKIMEQRREQIASGLAAAEQGKRDLELAQHKKEEILNDAKAQASAILESSNRRGNQIIEEAKARARTEGEQMLALAKSAAEQEIQVARDKLRVELAGLVVTGTERLLDKNLEQAVNENLLADLIKEI